MKDVEYTPARNNVMRVAWQLEKTPTWSSKIFPLVPSPVAKQPALSGLCKARGMSIRWREWGLAITATSTKKLLLFHVKTPCVWPDVEHKSLNALYEEFQELSVNW